MKMQHNKTGGSRKWPGKAWLSLFASALLVAVWAGYAAYVSDNGMPVVDDGSWSSEVLAEIHAGIVTSAPIRPANACGLGASSCFKCHNGKRAAKPGDKPWHTQHEKVNHSCAGCHKGNERLMIQSMAHKKLIKDPRAQSQETCQVCHAGDDMPTLLGKYQNGQ